MQLNPGGTLNHKYTGETAVRGSGLPYSVLRSTGTLLTCQLGYCCWHQALDNFLITTLIICVLLAIPACCFLSPYVSESSSGLDGISLGVILTLPSSTLL